MEDESSCFELDCCPLGLIVPDIVISEPLLAETGIALLTEDDVTILT